MAGHTQNRKQFFSETSKADHNIYFARILNLFLFCVMFFLVQKGSQLAANKTAVAANHSF